MYDVRTYSVFDTFLGKAVTGPLAKKKLQLKQASVVTTDWGTWKRAHPETTVLVETLALGRNFDFRNGRDANGPIFPIGDIDPRLPVHEDIIGLLDGAADGVKPVDDGALIDRVQTLTDAPATLADEELLRRALFYLRPRSDSKWANAFASVLPSSPARLSEALAKELLAGDKGPELAAVIQSILASSDRHGGSARRGRWPPGRIAARSGAPLSSMADRRAAAYACKSKAPA